MQSLHLLLVVFVTLAFGATASAQTPFADCTERCVADSGSGWFPNMPAPQQPVALLLNVPTTFDLGSHDVSVTLLLTERVSGECRVADQNCVQGSKKCKFSLVISMEHDGSIETAALGATTKDMSFPGNDWSTTTTRVDTSPDPNAPNALLVERDTLDCGTIAVTRVKVWFESSAAPLPGGQGTVGTPFPGASSSSGPSPPSNLWESPFINLACGGCDLEWWASVASFVNE